MGVATQPMNPERPVASLAALAPALQTLFLVRPLEIAADLGLVQRRRLFCPSAFAQGLVLGWLQKPAATIADLAAFVAAAGCVLTASALSQRLCLASAGLLQRLLAEASRQAVCAPRAVLPLLSRFAGVHVIDSTSLSLPAALAGLWQGCGGTAGATAAIKAVVRWDLLGGSLGLEMLQGRHADARSPLAAEDLPPGSLRLADLGFLDLDLLARHGRRGVFWISRVQANTVVRDGAGCVWKLWALLASRGQARIDEEILLGERERLPCRLVAERCPERIALKRRQAALDRASKKGHKVCEGTRSACSWTFFATNVPPEKLSAREVWVVYRVRWQIERLFKLWKSQGGLGRTQGTCPERILCETYAKMLAQVARHWLSLTAGGWWLGRSLWKSGAAAGLFGLALLLALGDAEKLQWLLGRLAEVLGAIGGVDPRKKKPAAWQTLEDPENDGMEHPGEAEGPAGPGPPPPERLT
jgi:hypothetical protein